MSKETGFQSYHIYNTIKYIHFKSKKYDITKMPLAKKEQFLKKWNEEMIHRPDSLTFLKLDKLYNKEELIRMFTYYYLEDRNFYVYSLSEDDFKLFKKMEFELSMIKDVLEKDFYLIYYLAMKNNKKLKHMLFSKKGIPTIFKIYDRGLISINTLVALHLAFGIGDRINYKLLNIVEEEKLKKYKLIFDKYIQIVYKYFDFDTKGVFKEHYEKLYYENLLEGEC